MDPNTEAQLIALGIQTVENLIEWITRHKAATGLTNADLLAEAAKINDAAVTRTQAFLDRIGVAA
jgi:hypothetical protein